MQCFHLKIQTRSLETAAFTRFLVMVVQSEKHPRGIWNSYKLQETPVPLQHVSWWDMTSWKNSFRCTTLGAHAQRVQHGRSQLQKRTHSFFIKIIQTITTKTEKEKKKTKNKSCFFEEKSFGLYFSFQGHTNRNPANFNIILPHIHCGN